MKKWYEIPELREKDTLTGLLAAGLSLADIADKCGCSVKPVRTAIRKNGINLQAIRMAGKRKR